jgi:hypothetical protein
MPEFLAPQNWTEKQVVLDLKVHSDLWEDIQDVAVSRSRRKEKGTALSKVKARLITMGKLAA